MILLHLARPNKVEAVIKTAIKQEANSAVLHSLIIRTPYIRVLSAQIASMPRTGVTALSVVASSDVESGEGQVKSEA